jgi:hypothetical protein
MLSGKQGIGPAGREDRMPRVDSPMVMLILCGIVGVPDTGAGAELKCASHSLSRHDASAAATAAHAGLPRSARPFVSGACWNPTNAYAWIETHPSVTSDGVKRWWNILCRREDSQRWDCDPAEFNQRIGLSLSIGGRTRRIDLDFDQAVPLERAQEIAMRAVSMYLDRTVELGECSSGETSDFRRWKTLPTGTQPIRVTVSRESSAESAYLTDAHISFDFPTVGDDAGAKVPCWDSWVVVD